MNPARESTLKPLTVPWIAMCAATGHMSLSASRVVVSLFALHQGGTAATVGLLLSIYALVPTLTSIAVGRLVDRLGTKPIMLFGLMLCALGMSIPLAIPHPYTLWLTSALIGGGWAGYQAASQIATGRQSPTGERTQSFAKVSLAVALSSMCGPMMAGFAVDLIGHRATFALVAVFPLTCALLVSLRQGIQPVPPPAMDEEADATTKSSIWDLFRFKGVRTSLILTAVMSVAWDAHALLIPVYGTKIQFSASEIGLLVSAFGAATFVIRSSVPLLMKRFKEATLVMTALVLIGSMYLIYPLVNLWAVLMVISFAIGLGCGCTQPIVLAQLHSSAPEHRIGEAVGLRIAVSNAVAMVLPLMLGAFATSFGFVPVFWTMAAVCFAAAYSQRKLNQA